MAHYRKERRRAPGMAAWPAWFLLEETPRSAAHDLRAGQSGRCRAVGLGWRAPLANAQATRTVRAAAEPVHGCHSGKEGCQQAPSTNRGETFRRHACICRRVKSAVNKRSQAPGAASRDVWSQLSACRGSPDLRRAGSEPEPKGTLSIRFLVIVKASKESEAGASPTGRSSRRWAGTTRSSEGRRDACRRGAAPELSGRGRSSPATGGPTLGSKASAASGCRLANSGGKG